MKWLIFSSTEYIFPRPQAFASPSDMASSSVWENVFLATTPTFDGVCGMLWYIILDVYIAKFWHICHWLLICANFYWFFVTDVVVTCNYNHFLADDIAFGCIWLMLLATVADVEATFYCVNPQCWFGRCYCHICLADVFCHSGWCIYQSCVGWCFCQLIQMEQPFVVTAINGLICGRWNGHCFCDWLMLLPWWQMLLPLVGMCQADVIALVADVIATGSILILVLCCWLEPHPRCEADGTCLCFYLGMDCWPL